MLKSVVVLSAVVLQVGCFGNGLVEANDGAVLTASPVGLNGSWVHAASQQVTIPDAGPAGVTLGPLTIGDNGGLGRVHRIVRTARATQSD